MARCEFLNTVRANYTICCQYPLFVAWRWNNDVCTSNCSSGDDFDCCMFTCNLRSLGILTDLVLDTGNETVGVNWQRLADSFLLSVGNKTIWREVIYLSIERCYEQYVDDSSMEYECGDQVPSYLYDIIDCSYIENFLKCPLWNRRKVKECVYTSQYVESCFIGRVFNTSDSGPNDPAIYDYSYLD